jgi:Holliday junction resolvase RusA-like endonuclease
VSIIRITIPGPPMGKPRMTQRDKWAKRPCVLRYREWADKARDCAAKAGGLPSPEKIRRITMMAYFSPPKSLPKWRRELMLGALHRVKPDMDNILKCMDALFTEDSAIPAGAIEKRWDETPRLEITIEVEDGN